MRYIPSKEIKEKNIEAEGLAKKSWMAPFLDEIFRKYGSVKLGTALDLGCGSGSTGILLSRYFSKVFGVDLNSYISEEAKKVINFSQADLNFDSLPYENNSFDVITGFQMIEHLENPFHVMREAHRVLRPGGLFIISFPNPFQWAFRLKFLFTGNIPPYSKNNNHLLFMTRDVFAKTYLANFDLLETRYQRGDIPMWGRINALFGRKSKHKKILPRSEAFARSFAHVLRKK